MLSPFQVVSYIKCMIIVCLTIFSSILISGGELHKLHDWCVTIFSSILSPFQVVSYIKCMIIGVFD